MPPLIFGIIGERREWTYESLHTLKGDRGYKSNRGNPDELRKHVPLLVRFKNGELRWGKSGRSPSLPWVLRNEVSRADVKQCGAISWLGYSDMICIDRNWRIARQTWITACLIHNHAGRRVLGLKKDAMTQLVSPIICKTSVGNIDLPQ